MTFREEIIGDARRVFDALSEYRRAELRAGDAGRWAVDVGIYEIRPVSPQFGVTVLTPLGEAVLALCDGVAP